MTTIEELRRLLDAATRIADNQARLDGEVAIVGSMKARGAAITELREALPAAVNALPKLLDVVEAARIHCSSSKMGNSRNLRAALTRLTETA